jgi:hypothetical protein
MMTKKVLLALLSLTVASVVIAAPKIVSMWTHPVLEKVELYGYLRAANFGGPLAGIAEEMANQVQLTVFDDISEAQFQNAIDDGATCETVTTWLCDNKTTVANVSVTNTITWRRPHARYCAARCKADSDFYAFVVLIGHTE